MRVLMISSHHMRGRYFEDFAKGALGSNLELGYMSLSNDSAPMWLQEYKIENLTGNSAFNTNFLSQLFCGFMAVSKFRPDIIQSHLFRASLLSLVLGLLKGIPTVLTRHHITEHMEVGSKLHQKIDRISAMAASHVIVFSEAAKMWLVDKESIEPNKITVINQGFDFEKLNPTRESILEAKRDLGFTPDTFNIVCVARYSKTKGQKYLVEAIDALKSHIPEIRLVFIGPGNFDWLSSIIDSLKLREFIRLEGYHENIPACLAAADLVVHPSLVDAFSQLLIEAQGVGAPLIATDIAAAREQIEDEVTGLIVNERSSADLANAIARLHQDRDKLRSLGINAAEAVRKKFSVKRMIEESQVCYAEILENLH